MIVVSDTTPIISLLKTGRLDILERLFGTVLIPAAVYDELTTDKRFSDEAAQILHCAFIQRVRINDERSVSLLRRATGLDLGESEAIYYADSQNADLLLMDEAKGRQVAKTMGLKIMGTIGILLSAYNEKCLTGEEIRQILHALQANGRFISDSLYQLVIDRITEPDKE